MTTKEKFQALQNLGKDVAIRLDINGNWYTVVERVEIGGDGILDGSAGRGYTPEQSVEALWNMYTKLPIGKYLVIDAFTKRRHAVWTDQGWKIETNL